MTETKKTDSRLGQYAGFITRLIAWMIDQAIILGLFWLIHFAVTFVVDRFIVDNQVYGLLANILIVIIDVIIYLVYFIGSWMAIGQTPGKSLMDLRIVRTDGGRLKLGNAVIRLFGYWVSALLFFMGFWWVLFDGRRQGWHDKLARTFVVYSETWEERAEQEILLREHLKQRRQQRIQQETDKTTPSKDVA